MLSVYRYVHVYVYVNVYFKCKILTFFNGLDGDAVPGAALKSVCGKTR